MRSVTFAILAHMMVTALSAKKARGEDPGNAPILLLGALFLAALVCAIMGW